MERGLHEMGCRVFSIILAIEQRDSYKAFLKLCLVSQADQQHLGTRTLALEKRLTQRALGKTVKRPN